ncbi:N-6 DNA methylase [Eubacterium pyruvativorans]|uniref:N-6 DNA methylase n=1 Tax=Eubacterium pyruvativorans TaxID=155865 RepID=UPI0030C77C02
MNKNQLAAKIWESANKMRSSIEANEYKELFSTWIGMGFDFSVDNVRTALSSFSRLISESHKKVFEGFFTTLETGLSKLGRDNRTQTKAVQDLIHLINDIPVGNYDVLGFIYEYLIEKFASNAGKKAGEFYTPHEVSVLMSEIVADHLQDRSEIRIYENKTQNWIQFNDCPLRGVA